MKSFLNFLIESKLDDELNCSPEKYFSVLENGELEEIANKGSFGGEVYINLDFPQLQSEAQALQETKKEDSVTVKTLSKRKEDGEDEFEKVQIRNTKYKLADDKITILKRNNKNEYKPITKSEIEEIILQRNKAPKSKSKKVYSFDEDNNLVILQDEDVYIIPVRERKKFIKTLNDKVNSDGKHYRFRDEKSGILLVNTTSWIKDGEKENVRDKDRFDNAQYKEITSKDEQEQILSLVNPTSNTTKSKHKKQLNYTKGRFTLDGKNMTPTELKQLVNSLNGNVGGDTKLLNPKGWGKSTDAYWNCYKISIAGSKIGDAVNFNLPPIVSCNKGVPCIKEGCYAIKAYALYPSARAAMDCNYSLLKMDSGYELFKKSMILALNTPKKDGGKKFSLCRIHVNGDFFAIDYLDAICQVAKECSHVKFWMYTKQYELLSEFKQTIPSNLCIIVSCWGKFNPFDYKNGKYSDLAKKFPLAYLDDASKESKLLNERIQKLLGKPKDIQVCPCTDAEEIITKCEKCQICFDKSLANNNLVFKKH